MDRRWIGVGLGEWAGIGKMPSDWGLIDGVDKDLGWIDQRFGPRSGRGWVGWKSVGNGLAYEPASVGMKVVCK